MVAAIQRIVANIIACGVVVIIGSTRTAIRERIEPRGADRTIQAFPLIRTCACAPC